MAQPTVYRTGFHETHALSQPATMMQASNSSLLERRKQTSSFLQPLELPSLPPLSQLLTDEKKNGLNARTMDTTTAAVLANAITSTQALVQPPTGAFLPQMTTTTATTTTTTKHPNDQANAVYDAESILPTDTMLYHQATLDPSLMDPYMLQSGLTATDQAILMGRQRQSSLCSTGSDKIYSFVAIPGTHHKKRPRRRYDEIERLYHCNFEGCTKSYGTLNHLNAHVSMQQHGPKRQPSEFKEMRKEWRRQKKEKEGAKKAAEAVFHQQQQQQQQPFHTNMLQYPYQATLANFY
ncbi:hypothetical protein BY458DRAFT_512422 [Sporodiniella umbellata]|nr:hypothetical protein BY458DRAFT_512422 [Sporodiniella umbellata]